MALALTALAAGGVAIVAATSGRLLVLARHDATAIALGLEALEVLRAGPRAARTDIVSDGDGTSFARRWRATAGRGRPDPLAVRVTWPGHQLDLATEAAP